MKPLRILLLFFVLAAGGCARSESSPGEQQQRDAEVGENVRTELDADWLSQPFYREFSAEVRDIVKRERNVLRFNLDDDADPEYMAWVSLDRLNGLGILFDARGGRYEPVYEVREPIHQVSFHQQSRSLILAAGRGGTGLQWNWFRIIRQVDGSFREVWSGVERSMLFGVPPFTERYGSINITSQPDDTWVLLHSTTYTVFNEQSQAMETRARTDKYVFGPGSTRFVPADDVPGVGKYLVLDRSEAFGAPVAVLVAGLEQVELDAARVELVDADGNVIATGHRDGRDIFTIAPIDSVKPGTYTVRLTRSIGGREEVLDRVPFTVRKRLTVTGAPPLPARR